MICPNCGAENSENSRFCYQCGGDLYERTAAETELLVEDYPEPPTGTPSMPNSAGAQSMPYMPIQQNLPGGAMNPVMPSQKPPKKKMKKSLIAIIAIVGVLVIGSIGSLVFLPQIERAVLGDTLYYLRQESKTIETFVPAKEVLELFEGQEFSASSTAYIDTYGESFTVDADVNYNNADTFTAVGNATYEGEEFANLGIIYTEGQLALKDLENGNDIIVDSSVLEELGYDSSDNTQIDYEALMSAIESLIEDSPQIIKRIEKEALNDCLTTSKKEYNGKRYTTTTLVITGEDIIEITNILIEELSTYEYKDIVDNLLATTGENITLTDIQKLVTDTWTDDSTAYIVNIYYNARGRIIAREYGAYYDYNKSTGEYKHYDIFTIDTSVKNNLSVSNEFDIFEHINYTLFNINTYKSNGAYNLFVTIGEDNDATIDITNVKIEKLNGVKVLTGSIVYNSSYLTEEYSAGISVDGSYDINATINFDGEEEFSLQIISYLGNVADTSDAVLPESSTDAETFFSELFGYLLLPEEEDNPAPEENPNEEHQGGPHRTHGFYNFGNNGNTNNYYEDDDYWYEDDDYWYEDDDYWYEDDDDWYDDDWYYDDDDDWYYDDYEWDYYDYEL